MELVVDEGAQDAELAALAAEARAGNARDEIMPHHQVRALVWSMAAAVFLGPYEK
jgi:hypothetical protein